MQEQLPGMRVGFTAGPHPGPLPKGEGELTLLLPLGERVGDRQASPWMGEVERCREQAPRWREVEQRREQLPG